MQWNVIKLTTVSQTESCTDEKTYSRVNIVCLFTVIFSFELVLEHVTVDGQGLRIAL